MHAKVIFDNETGKIWCHKCSR